MGYKFSLSGEVLEVLLTRSPREQHQLSGWFAELAKLPDQSSDAEFRGPDGRSYCIALRREWVITYWLDFPIREVRFVAIERCV